MIKGYYDKSIIGGYEIIPLFEGYGDWVRVNHMRVS